MTIIYRKISRWYVRKLADRVRICNESAMWIWMNMIFKSSRSQMSYCNSVKKRLQRRCEFCENFKNFSLTEHLWMTVSGFFVCFTVFSPPSEQIETKFLNIFYHVFQTWWISWILQYISNEGALKHLLKVH